MLEIRTCVLAAPGIEIRVPAGTFLENPEDREDFDGVTIRSHDGLYRMQWEVVEDVDESTEQGLVQLLEDMESSSIVYPIAPITVNGLTGHCVAYDDSRCGNYEARFDLSEHRQILFYIVTEPGLKIDKIMQTQEFHDALNAVFKTD